MSRHAASRQIRGKDLRRQLAAAGVAVRSRSDRGLAEEAPFAYKDIDASWKCANGPGSPGVSPASDRSA